MTEACTSWLCWEGWEFVGVVLTALGLIAVALALYELQKASRRAPDVILETMIIGSARVNDLGRFHTLEIRNLGAAACTFEFAHLVNARAHLADGFKLKPHLAPGEVVTILVTAESLAKAWIRFGFRSANEWDSLRVQWDPLARDGPLGKQFLDDVSHARRNTWVRLVRGARIKLGKLEVPVWPGANPIGVIPWGRRGRGDLQKLINSGSSELMFSVMPVGYSIKDLPVVNLDA